MWLDHNDSDGDIFINGYSKPIRRDNNNHQRRVLVYLSKSAPAKQ